MPVGDPAVVVESGPVVYDDAAAEDEEEDEEEACVSAMDLLGGNGQSQLPVSRFKTPPFPSCDHVRVTSSEVLADVFSLSIWCLDSEPGSVSNDPPEGRGARRRRRFNEASEKRRFPSLCLRL